MSGPARRGPGARSLRFRRGLPLRAVAPNAVTALALCSGLSGIRFAIDARWEFAVLMVLVAGVVGWGCSGVGTCACSCSRRVRASRAASR